MICNRCKIPFLFSQMPFLHSGWSILTFLAKDWMWQKCFFLYSIFHQGKVFIQWNVNSFWGVCIIHWALITVYSCVIIYKEDTDISLTPANLPIHIYILPTSRRQVFMCFSVSTYFCLFRNVGCVSPSNVSSCTSVFCSFVHCQAFAVGHIAAQISSFLSLCNLWVIFSPSQDVGNL